MHRIGNFAYTPVGHFHVPSLAFYHLSLNAEGNKGQCLSAREMIGESSSRFSRSLPSFRCTIVITLDVFPSRI